MERGYVLPISGRRGMGGIQAWWQGTDIGLEEAYATGRARGLLVGAGAVGLIWAGFIGWYMWRK